MADKDLERIEEERNAALGTVVRRYRERLGLTQPQFAERVGKGSQQIHRYEAGKTEIPLYVLQAIADVAGVTLARITREAEDEFLGAADASPAKPEPSAFREDRRFYRYTTGKRLPPKAYELMYSYIDQLEAAGFDGEEINEAEEFLFNGAFNKINARDPSEKSEEDLLLDIKAAWQFVRDVAARSGRKL